MDRRIIFLSVLLVVSLAQEQAAVICNGVVCDTGCCINEECRSMDDCKELIYTIITSLGTAGLVVVGLFCCACIVGIGLCVYCCAKKKKEQYIVVGGQQQM